MPIRAYLGKAGEEYERIRLKHFFRIRHWWLLRKYRRSGRTW